MRILFGLTYYRPHVSGLTIYVERLARALAARGHAVTVLASRHDRSLAREETVDGVRVVRVPVAFGISKGVVMPTYGLEASRETRRHDVVNVNLPQLEAWWLVARARLLGRPTIATYHCDVELPEGFVNRVAERAVGRANAVALRLSRRVVAYTREYADHSALLRRHAEKVEVIPPPVEMPAPSPAEVAAFLARHRLTAAGGEPPRLVGMAARLATEKGVETLLAAAPRLLQRFPGAVFLFAGQHEGVVGEERYRRTLAPAVEALGERWRFLGPLHPVGEMPAFLGALDCLVVPSVNSTESFGLVQVEAMLCGTPAVASDLPGVRQPVLHTGMGEITAPRDPVALADAIARVLVRPERYRRPRAEIAALFDSERTATAYEALFRRELVRAAGGDRRLVAGS